jgi:hypothetical protein
MLFWAYNVQLEMYGGRTPKPSPILTLTCYVTLTEALAVVVRNLNGFSVL